MPISKSDVDRIIDAVSDLKDDVHEIRRDQIVQRVKSDELIKDVEDIKREVYEKPDGLLQRLARIENKMSSSTNFTEFLSGSNFKLMIAAVVAVATGTGVTDLIRIIAGN